MAKELINRINSNYSSLSKNEKKIADFLVSIKANITFISLSEIGEKSNSSKSAVSKMFKKIGYKTYKEAQDGVKNNIYGHSPLENLTNTEAGKINFEDKFLSTEIDNLKNSFLLLDEKTINILIENIKKGKTIWVVGARNGYLLARYIYGLLSEVKKDVRILSFEAQNYSLELTQIDKSDFVIVFDYRRHLKLIEDIIIYLEKKEISLSIFTNANSDNNKNDKEITIYTYNKTETLFDSYISTMSIINFIVAKYVKIYKSESLENMKSIEQVSQDILNFSIEKY